MPEGSMPQRSRYQILGCSSQGNGSDDEARLRALLSGFDFRMATFNRKARYQAFRALLRQMRADRYTLFVLEGTGLAAGLAAIVARVLFGMPYVVSSGDAVAPYLSAQVPLGAPVFGFYERLLYKHSSGFIGWTPYLVGRALTFGAKMGATIPGWAPPRQPGFDERRQRSVLRARLGIAEEAIVFGMAGSLNWSKRYKYCYGLELVRAARASKGRATVLIVGDGTGLKQLKEIAGDMEGKHIFFTGRVPKEEVENYLAAMDVGSLPQSVNQVGSFRFTTKLPEYRAARLLIATNEIPAAYDLDRGDVVRIKGGAPWEDVFIEGMAELMDTLDRGALEARRVNLVDDGVFDRERQIARATAFLGAVMDGCDRGASANVSA